MLIEFVVLMFMLILVLFIMILFRPPGGNSPAVQQTPTQ